MQLSQVQSGMNPCKLCCAAVVSTVWHAPMCTVQAAEAGLGTSLMERLQQAGLPVQLLQVQYRMHPLLAAWPSATFYQGRLVSHPTPAERRPLPGRHSHLNAHLLNLNLICFSFQLFGSWYLHVGKSMVVTAVFML